MRAVILLSVALAACQSAPPANNQAAVAPAPAAQPETPVAVAERLVRARVGGDARFVEAAVRAHQGVNVVCGAYQQGDRRQRYIVVNGEDVFIESEMAAGEMPRAINEFCSEGGRA